MKGFSYLCIINIPNMDKDINRLKVVLAEKKRTNKWLAEQLGCAPTTVSMVHKCLSTNNGNIYKNSKTT